MGHPNLAGDLAYYPSGKSGTSKSFSDTGFGMPRQQMAYQPPYQSGYVSFNQINSLRPVPYQYLLVSGQ